MALPHGVRYVHKPTEASNTTHPLGNIALDGCLVVKLFSKSSPLYFAERKHSFKLVREIYNLLFQSTQIHFRNKAIKAWDYLYWSVVIVVLVRGIIWLFFKVIRQHAMILFDKTLSKIILTSEWVLGVRSTCSLVKIHNI